MRSLSWILGREVVEPPHHRAEDLRRGFAQQVLDARRTAHALSGL
jgi:hypothetical protein